MDPLFHLLLAILVIVIAARAAGALFSRLGQPPVIGEMIAGMLLGPSFLGQLAPSVAATILPKNILPSLGMLAQIGVLLFMFLVGLELDTSEVRKHRRASLMISNFSVLVPFVLGMGLALLLYPRFAGTGVPKLAFVLFIGSAISVTAFPVLARIVKDSGLSNQPIGMLALTCAAIDDVSAWCLLAFATSAINGSVGAAVATVVLTGALVGTTLLVGRPLLVKVVGALDRSGEPIGRSAVAYALCALLLMAMLAEGIGIHAVFGAFLAGVVVPHDSKLALALREKLEDVVMIVFLPPFFAFSGLRTELGLVTGLNAWLWTLALLAVASVGKIGSTVVAARYTGHSWRDSTSLGLLMNARGAVGLVVLNIGLDLKILSPTVFAMMVMMAITTTFATPPLLRWVRRGPALSAR